LLALAARDRTCGWVRAQPDPVDTCRPALVPAQLRLRAGVPQAQRGQVLGPQFEELFDGGLLARKFFETLPRALLGAL
jgi:hypothetical protein